MSKASKGKAAADRPVMNDDLREQMAQALLAGADADDVARRIASQGFPLALVEAEVARAQKDRKSVV
jgi:hypothetical protein